MTPTNLLPIIRQFNDAGFAAESWEDGILHVTIPSEHRRGHLVPFNDADLRKAFDVMQSATDIWTATMSQDGANLEFFDFNL